jgi:hypothetical protein
MSVREAINSRKSLGYGVAGFFALVAISVLVATQLPSHKIKGDRAFYTDDDGQTWFTDSKYLIAPFDHSGKTAVKAVILSYDHGNKTFCAYLQRYSADAKKRLEAAVSDAAGRGKGPETVTLFGDLGIARNEIEVKLPGPGHKWVVTSAIEGQNTINEGMAVHADDTSDAVVPN